MRPGGVGSWLVLSCIVFGIVIQLWEVQQIAEAKSIVVWNIKHFGNRRYPELRPHVCDIKNEPCAKLNDLWGYKFYDQDGEGSKAHFVAIVGAANGWDFVDVTDPHKPEAFSFVPSCINNWRSTQIHGKTIYSVADFTPTCNCDIGQKCLEHMIVLDPPEVAGAYSMTEGRLTKQLKETGPVTGSLIPVTPWGDKGCNMPSNVAALAGNIALVPVGQCEIVDKILNVQKAGAISILLVNDADEIIYPALTGDSTQVNISGALIGMTDGLALKNSADAGANVRVSLTHNNLMESPLFSPPEGLTMIDITDPWHPALVAHKRDHFQFAHNLYIEQERGYLYVCGMSDRKEGQGGMGDNRNGGIIIYDVNEEASPKMIADWNTTYINDMFHRKCGERHLLFATGIFSDDIYIIDVTDPKHMVDLLRFHVPFMVSHLWVDEKCSVLYLTHERGYEPLTVWAFWADANGNMLYNYPPKYLGALNVKDFNLGTSPHNIFVSGNVLWGVYFDSGVAAWNLTDPRNPSLLAHANAPPGTTPPGVHSVWALYPWDDSGYVYANDQDGGLFVLRLESSDQIIIENYVYDGFTVARGFAVFFAVLCALLLLCIVIGGWIVNNYYIRKPYEMLGKVQPAQL